MTVGRDGLSKSETIVVAAIARGAPSLVQAREVIVAFQAMVRRRLLAELEPWREPKQVWSRHLPMASSKTKPR